MIAQDRRLIRVKSYKFCRRYFLKLHDTSLTYFREALPSDLGAKLDYNAPIRFVGKAFAYVKRRFVILGCIN